MLLDAKVSKLVNPLKQMRHSFPKQGKVNVEVIYKGLTYTINNERHGEVELWRNGKFAFCAKQLSNGTIRKL